MILPYALFHSLFLAAVVLGMVEACHLVITVDELSVYQRFLAAFIVSPFALFGIVVATLSAALLTILTRTMWVTSHQQDGPPGRVHILAAVVATATFVLALFLVTHVFWYERKPRKKSAPSYRSSSDPRSGDLIFLGNTQDPTIVYTVARAEYCNRPLFIALGCRSAGLADCEQREPGDISGRVECCFCVGLSRSH